MSSADRSPRRWGGATARLLLGLTLAAPGAAQTGLAQRYPGDVGIADDPAVVFHADFEQATVGEVAARWSDARNTAGMRLVPESPPASSGAQALEMSSLVGSDTGGHLYVSFPQGHDRLYARFYVKFSADCKPVHHFVHMGGYNPPTPWPQGGAGERPAGNDRFSTGIEPFGDTWHWDFYSYWMHMRGNPGGPEYWGNDFNPVPQVDVPCDQWVAVELMITLNDPVGAYNGEQAFWVDGVQRHHLGEGFPNGYWVWDSFYPDPGSAPFEGFQWRNDPALRLSFFWLLYYVTQGPDGQRDTVLFDDVVVATEYIGPIARAAPLLKAVKSGGDLRLSWTGGSTDYRLLRSPQSDMSGAGVLYQGPATSHDDLDALADVENWYYSVE